MRVRTLLALAAIAVLAVAFHAHATVEPLDFETALADVGPAMTPVPTEAVQLDESNSFLLANECSTCIRHCKEDTGESSDWCRTNVCQKECGVVVE